MSVSLAFSHGGGYHKHREQCNPHRNHKNNNLLDELMHLFGLVPP